MKTMYDKYTCITNKEHTSKDLFFIQMVTMKVLTKSNVDTNVDQ